MKLSSVSTILFACIATSTVAKAEPLSVSHPLCEAIVLKLKPNISKFGGIYETISESGFSPMTTMKEIYAAESRSKELKELADEITAMKLDPSLKSGQKEAASKAKTLAAAFANFSDGLDSAIESGSAARANSFLRGFRSKANGMTPGLVAWSRQWEKKCGF